MQRISFSCPESLAADLAFVARDQRRSVSQTVVLALESYLARDDRTDAARAKAGEFAAALGAAVKPKAADPGHRQNTRVPEESGETRLAKARAALAEAEDPKIAVARRKYAQAPKTVKGQP